MQVRPGDMKVRPSDARHVKLGYLRANSFEAMVAISAVVSGVSVLVSSAALDGTSLGRVLGAVALAYAAMLVVGGALIVAGLARQSPRLELAGLSLLSAGTLANAVTIIAVRGWGGVPTAVFYVGFVVAAVTRSHLVLRLLRVGLRDVVRRGGS